MNVFQLTSAGKLVLTEAALPENTEGKIKVRVTKVMLSRLDAALFKDEIKVKYPIVPGRFAVGIIAENFGDDYPKGTRVLLHTFLPAEDTGSAKKDFSERDYDVCGQTRDGFLRDIVYLTPNELTILPDSVNDEEALLLHHVALVNAIVEQLEVHKGQHVAVVGANGPGILLCQLLMYRQAAPVLIDTEQARLDFARTCGIYYTMLADETLLEQMGNVTGGRLADGAIFMTDATWNDPTVALLSCRRGANVVFGGFSSDRLTLNLSAAIEKQLSVYGISDCVGHLETAINLVANNAVNTDNFKAVSIPVDSLFEHLEQTLALIEQEEVYDYIYFKLL